MAYAASIRTGLKATRYTRSREKGRIRRFFSVLSRVLGMSLMLVMSLGFLGLISLGLLLGYNKAVNSDFFALKDIEVIGNRQLTYAELTEQMNIHPGDSLLQLRMSKLQARLEQNPWIATVAVTREFPDRVMVRIKERQAYFWVQDDHRLFYADERGRIISEISPRRFVSLPILHVRGEQQEADLGAVVGFLESRNFPFPLQDVSWIRIRESGTVEIGISRQNLLIVLDRAQLGRSASRLSLVWADIKNQGEAQAVQRITLAGRNAWVAYAE
ncbi:cell division protein FtsQ/DivIB [Desulfonatronovibrio hydrogenovorans]|uniref:cell division protein FtsQ/DivIB n=1 Tax=Desulfonatronovibrio hydrogenovorans TaxID=53245 RepID=UPI00048B68A7|nr:FtsQ-type POTRA domain-containing protein [Desulfonatronovibrio hydrogenovorans]